MLFFCTQLRSWNKRWWEDKSRDVLPLCGMDVFFLCLTKPPRFPFQKKSMGLRGWLPTFSSCKLKFQMTSAEASWGILHSCFLWFSRNSREINFPLLHDQCMLCQIKKMEWAGLLNLCRFKFDSYLCSCAVIFFRLPLTICFCYCA